jgi:hypothetical protein
MMIITVFVLIFSILLLSYGVYLLSLMNKDLTDNKVLPDYVKSNLKLVGSLSIALGLLGLAYCAWCVFGKNKVVNNKYDLFNRKMTDSEFEDATLESIDPESNAEFGFKFY